MLAGSCPQTSALTIATAPHSTLAKSAPALRFAGSCLSHAAYNSHSAMSNPEQTNQTNMLPKRADMPKPHTHANDKKTVTSTSAESRLRAKFEKYLRICGMRASL